MQPEGDRWLEKTPSDSSHEWHELAATRELLPRRASANAEPPGDGCIPSGLEPVLLSESQSDAFSGWVDAPPRLKAAV